MKLIKGQRLKLSDLTQNKTISLRLTVSGLKEKVSFYCLALDKSEKLLQPTYLIHLGQSQSPCQAIVMQNQNIAQTTFILNLSKLPSEAKELIFVISMGEQTGTRQENASDITEGALTILEGDVGQELARYAFTSQDFEGEKVLVLGKIYYKNAWRLALVSSGFQIGLKALLPHYGVPDGILIPQEAPAPSRQTESLVSDVSTSGDIARVKIPATWPGEQQPDMPQGLTNAVGLILVDNNDGKQSSGTGFVVNPGGYLLSCYHVVDDAKKISICMSGTNVLRPVNYVVGSQQHDAALLWISDGNGLPYWMTLVAPDEEPKLAEPLGLLGYPLGLDLGLSVSYSQGIINSLRQRGNRPQLQIDAGAASGSSGSPVFRRSDGRVVGILQSGFERHGMLINMAWDIRAFWKLGWHTA